MKVVPTVTLSGLFLFLYLSFVGAFLSDQGTVSLFGNGRLAKENFTN